MSEAEAKREIRERVWRLLEERGAARFPRPIKERIPNFAGSEVAARRVLGTREFESADVVKINPDYPQLGVRKGVLDSGKLLIMPSPRLIDGFLLLDPDRIPLGRHREAATIRGAFRHAERLDLEDLPFVDLVVCGSMAVTPLGVRVGKGGGYSELEYAVLRELELIDEGTPIITTVHDLQIVEDAPVEDHDFTVDIIATPSKMTRTSGPRYRPSGIIWERLSEEQIERMPVLQKLRKSSSQKG